MKKALTYLGQAWLLFCTALVCLFLGIILFQLFSQGSGSISWEFLTEIPTQGLTKGGILPAITGTVLLTFLTVIFAVPFGIGGALYLNEYSGNSSVTGWVRASIRNLAGVPSVIYGLFGLALFVQSLHFGTSVFSAGLTLGLLSLPYIITSTEEALKNIPVSTREASMALGATQFETIRHLLLPQATPGILTGVILSVSRAAGETAPILFTGAAFYTSYARSGLSEEFMALPYHLYMLSTQHQMIEEVRPLAYGTAVVLISLVFLLNLAAIWIRYRSRTS